MSADLDNLSRSQIRNRVINRDGLTIFTSITYKLSRFMDILYNFWGLSISGAMLREQHYHDLWMECPELDTNRWKGLKDGGNLPYQPRSKYVIVVTI